MATQPDMSMFGGGPDMSMFSATPQRPKPVSRIENIGRGLKGAYGQAVMSGSFVQPVRWVMEATNFGGYNEKLRQKFPGQTEEWYKKKRDELYDEAILIGRDNARAQVENNPYPGQTVGNFIAAVPGSVGFTDILLPGSTIAKGAFKGTARQVAGNVAKHVGKQAAVQGTLGGIEDTIAQGFDIAEGLQEGIDTQRLGQNAAFSAALGGGFGGVQAGVHAPAFQRAVEQSNAPDFIKGLFLERGRDLVPEAPEFKSQVGQVIPAMLPENITQHRKVLATGTKDDIDAFYNSVGGPRPSPESIDNWLVERDSFSTPVAPKADVIERQIHRDNMRAHVENATQNWKNKPKVNLYDTLDDMEPKVKEAAIKDGVTPENTIGFYSPVDGQVHIFTNQIKTPEALNAVLFHESLGHYGLANQYGTSLDKTLRTLVAKNVGQFGKKVDQWVIDHPGAYNGDRIRAAEEVLAEMSEKGPLPKSIGDAVVAGVRRFARNMGIDLKYGDTEVRHILAMAHNAVINGKGRDVITNRFGGLNAGQDETSRRMYVGPGNRVINPTDEGWFQGPDGKWRNEISDHEAHWDDEASYMDRGRHGVNLDEVLIHPELFKAYPELRNVKVIRSSGDKSTQGYFDPAANELHVSTTARDPASTALHEIQHWIQFKEGFALGGNSDMFRLDNKQNLQTLLKHYENELEYIQEFGIPRGREASAKGIYKYLDRIQDPRQTVENKIKKVQTLLDSNNSLKPLYSYLDDVVNKATLYEDQLEAIRSKMDRASPMEQAVLGQKAAQINKNLTDTIQQARKAVESLTKLKGKFSDLTYDMYKILTGEVEARDTQARRHMTPEERKEIAPFTIEDLKPEEMITATSVDQLMKSEDAPKAPHISEWDIDNYSRERDRIKKYRAAANDPDRSPQDRARFAEQADRYQDTLDTTYVDLQPYIDREADKWIARGDQAGATVDADNINYNPEIDVARVWDQRDSSQPAGEFRSRREAQAFIRSKNKDEQQFFGMDRADGSRFMTPEQLQRSLDDGDIDIKNLEHTYENYYKDYVPTYRSDAEVRRAAQDMGMTTAKIKKMKDMEDLSARIWRTEKAADALWDRISGLLDKQGTPDWSLRDADNLSQALIDHNYILSKLWDDKSEIARAMRVSKMGYTKSSLEAYRALLAEHGGSFSGLADEETLNRFARSLKTIMANGKNPNGLNILVKGLGKPNWEEYLLSARTNMMLSGMSTHVTAVQDMINGIGFNLMDHTAGLIPSLGREGLRALGINLKPGLHPAEVGARYWGILRAAMDAATYVNSLQTLKNGSQAVTSGGRQYARIPLLSKVGDLIAAEDQFFRAFSTNMHLYGLGVRQAVEEARKAGTRPTMDDLITQGANYARSPSPDLLKEAQKAAEVDLLLAPNWLTTPIDALRNKANRTTKANGIEERTAEYTQRVGNFIVNFLFPFVRTATNSLYRRVIQRTPLTMLDPRTLAELQSGGASADIAMGRIMLGAASVAIAWEAAGKGLITGEGPENPNKKAIKMATGWRPKSVVNEDNYGINQNLGNRLNPWDHNSQVAGMVAGLREAYEKGANEGQVASGMKIAMYSIMKNLADNVWLGDLGDMVETALEPGVRGDVKRDQLIAQQVTSVLPNLLGQIARTNDQGNPLTSNKGDLPQTIIDTAKSKIPGLRETLPDRMTPFGQPVQGGATLAGQKTGLLPQGNRVTGGQFIEKNMDEVVQEVSRLDDLFEQSILTPVQRKITIDGEKIELTNREFSEYQKEAGQRITETIREAMGSEEWAEWDDEQKASWIKKMQKQIKKEVREELYGGDEDEE